MDACFYRDSFLADVIFCDRNGEIMLHFQTAKSPVRMKRASGVNTLVRVIKSAESVES